MDSIIEAIIEIPMGSKNKYEICKDRNMIKLDRVLYSSMSYPAEYGYIDNTLALDGDPLDILVLSSEPTFPGCIVTARIIGYLHVIDNGAEDYKLIAVNHHDPRFDHIDTIDDVTPHSLVEIKNFFETYKKLQGIPVHVNDYHTREEALELLVKCRERYLEQKNHS